MPTTTCHLDIHAAQTALFHLTQDYARRLEWDPFLKEARLVGAEQPEVGARSWCVARSGLGMETVYISYQPPRVVAIKMTRGPWILERFAGSWRFDYLAEQETRVTFRYHILARPRWLRPVLDPLLRIVFARDMEQRLHALKKVAENSY
jgi:ribosome-associated toxin RatA of RatAB toxin-antitoxin module